MWYSWPDMDAFNVWHDAARAALGLPRPGVNASTGEVQESAAWTTSYVEPVVGDDVRAEVEQHVAEMVPEGLGIACDGPLVGIGWTFEDGTFVPPPAPDDDGGEAE
jgi:hypothetical protein